MQKTNFKFEAIVHDDVSTDGSAKIIAEYAAKYPDIIKPIYETENQFSKRDGSLERIINEACRGKYIALCEGDDYWTDPLKLQKQVDFLESNPDYTMCFHNAIEHYQNNSIQDSLFWEVHDREYDGLEFYKNWIVATASVVFRKSCIQTKLYNSAIANKNFFHGDIILFLTCASLGKVRGFSDVMSVYRKHDGGVTHNRNREFHIKCIYQNKDIPIYFGNKYLEESKNRVSKFAFGTFCQNKVSGFRYLLLAFYASPSNTVSMLIDVLRNKISNL